MPSSKKPRPPRFPPRVIYRPPAIRAEVPTAVEHQLVYTSGMGTLGAVHRHALLSNGERAKQTVCGNWPGRPTPTTPVLDVTDDPCPVCFRE